MSHFLRMMQLASLALAPLLVTADALAQDYPNRPVRLIIPYGVGGNTDVVARQIGPRLASIIGQSVVIENRGGGAGIPGMAAVAKAPADGYTLLFAASNFASNPILYKELPYDALKDFAAIGLVAVVPTVLIVSPQLPVKSTKELIELAHAKPGVLNYGSVGNGSGNHLTTEVFSHAAEVKVQHVPYKSASTMLTDLIGNRLDFVFSTITSAHGQITTGQVKPLAVSSLERSSALPDVPTVSESGVPGFDVSTWLGILAPAGTPPDVVKKLNAALVQVLSDPEIREQLKSLGANPAGGTPEQFSAHLKVELDRWVRLAKTVKFEVN